jgi:hypothetical protein
MKESIHSKIRLIEAKQESFEKVKKINYKLLQKTCYSLNAKKKVCFLKIPSERMIIALYSVGQKIAAFVFFLRLLLLPLLK